MKFHTLRYHILTLHPHCRYLVVFISRFEFVICGVYAATQDQRLEISPVFTATCSNITLESWCKWLRCREKIKRWILIWFFGWFFFSLEGWRTTEWIFLSYLGILALSSIREGKPGSCQRLMKCFSSRLLSCLSLPLRSISLCADLPDFISCEIKCDDSWKGSSSPPATTTPTYLPYLAKGRSNSPFDGWQCRVRARQ